MSTPPKELIAIAHYAFINNEAALKQLATIFNRISFGALSVALHPNFDRLSTPEFLKNKSMLVDLGILCEFDTKNWKPAADSSTRHPVFSLFDDINEILRPFGVSVEEMIAARNDKVEAKRLREKMAVPLEELAAKVPDHERLIQTERRLTVNTTRMNATQVRNQENSEAYATIPSGDSSLDDDDQHPDKHDVLKIAVVVPVPDEQASWQQIIEYRNDPDSQARFFELKEWMSDLTRGVIAEVEAQQKLEFLLDQYRRVMQRNEIQINWTKLEAFVVISADDSHKFRPFKKDQSASPLFSVESRKLALLETESTLPGSIVAFVIQAKSMFTPAVGYESS
jgi:hypothetical protein